MQFDVRILHHTSWIWMQYRKTVVHNGIKPENIIPNRRRGVRITGNGNGLFWRSTRSQKRMKKTLLAI